MMLKIRGMGKQAATYGTSFGILSHRFIRRTRKGKTEILFNMPFLKPLSIYDCWPDTDATTPEDMIFFGHDEWVTIEQLKASNAGNIERYFNLKELEEQLQLKQNQKEKEGQSSNQDTAQYGEHIQQIRRMNNRGRYNRFLVARRYTRDRWETIVPEFGLVIEDQENPYDHGGLPVHTLYDHDHFDQIYGIGELDPIRQLHIALNQTINMRMDNVKNILESPFQARKSALQYKHTWKMKRNQIWVVNEIGDVQPFNIQDVTGRTFNITTNFFKDSMARALGRFDVLTRNESATDRTATEVTAALGEQNARLKYKELNVDDFIEGLATQFLQINQQFMTTAQVIRIIGKETIEALERDAELLEQDIEGVPIPGEVRKVPAPGFDAPIPKFSKAKDGSHAFFVVEPEDIAGQFDYITESGSMTSPNTVAQLTAAKEAIKTTLELSDHLEAKGFEVNFVPLLHKIYDNLGIKITDNIIKKMEEVPEIPQPDVVQDSQGLNIAEQRAAQLPQPTVPQQPASPTIQQPIP
jgi:hypothetical protein